LASGIIYVTKNSYDTPLFIKACYTNKLTGPLYKRYVRTKTATNCY